MKFEADSLAQICAGSAFGGMPMYVSTHRTERYTIENGGVSAFEETKRIYRSIGIRRDRCQQFCRTFEGDKVVDTLTSLKNGVVVGQVEQKQTLLPAAPEALKIAYPARIGHIDGEGIQAGLSVGVTIAAAGAVLGAACGSLEAGIRHGAAAGTVVGAVIGYPQSTHTQLSNENRQHANKAIVLAETMRQATTIDQIVEICDKFDDLRDFSFTDNQRDLTYSLQRVLDQKRALLLGVTDHAPRLRQNALQPPADVGDVPLAGRHYRAGSASAAARNHLWHSEDGLYTGDEIAQAESECLRYENYTLAP